MYEAFWSLEDPPFVLTPDPRFLLRARAHHDILTSLLYGIASQKGLMVVIGDVGTGKTTLCRALLTELPRGVRSALVLNPHLSDAELVATILDDLGVEAPRGAGKGELMRALGQYLLAAGAEGTTVVVILDEAQQMSAEALEQLRLLSTLETATRKLLQIVLVGQPELEGLLGRHELRQLDQRVGIRCYLGPLTRKETFRYIEHRLRIAGLAGPLPFSPRALRRIHEHSRGIPRAINLVCDRALMLGFGARAREIGRDLVNAAIRNLEGERRRRRGAWRFPGWRPMAAAGGLVAVLLGAWALADRDRWRPALVELVAARLPASARLHTADASATPLPPAPALPAPAEREPAAVDDIGDLVVRLLTLWGVESGRSARDLGGWPRSPDGSPDIPAIAAGYRLAATFLPEATLAELRAIDRPALVELRESGPPRAYLLRGLERDTAILTGPRGDERRLTTEGLFAAWSGSMWILWRNADRLPEDPSQGMTPAVLDRLATRLLKQGYLAGPLPTAPGPRFQEAVRRFQRYAALREDGLVGPRTMLALAHGADEPRLSALRSP
jgi:general secretion pathway protein A